LFPFVAKPSARRSRESGRFLIFFRGTKLSSFNAIWRHRIDGGKGASRKGGDIPAVLLLQTEN